MGASKPLTPDGDPLLAARFSVPAIPGTFVRRPRLAERLTQGVQAPLTLVNGPAGAGKTLLVADWVTANGPPYPAAWLTVESEDHSPGVFWTYALESIRHHGLALPHDIGSPARPGEVDRSLLTRLADRLSAQPEPLILILDEFDRVAMSADIADELQFVLRHAGDGLRLVIISRTEPLLPLHRYRAAGEVVDIRGADLAFLPAETADLVDRHGLGLPEAGARALTERTRGWAAGLRLCVLAAQHADDPETFLKDFEAGQSTLADFLLAEVLDTQPPETQDLLLRVSILDQIHPELANALTGRDDGERILLELQRANAFASAIGHSWYRLHPLFVEILRVHLRVQRPGLEPELHRTAARWLGEAGLLAEALPHAVTAGDWEPAAARFIDELAIAHLLTGLDAERFDALFAAMPPDASGPAADLVRAAHELSRHDVERGLDRLRRAAENLPDDQAHPGAALRFSCALLRVLAARMTGSADLAEAAAEDVAAEQRMLPAERLEQHPELSALMLTDLGSAQLWAGRLDAARATLSAATQTPRGPLTACPRHECLSRLALIELLHGRPGRAEAYVGEAAAEAERSGLLPGSRTGVAELVLAAVALDREELDAARTHLDRAAGSSVTPNDPILTAGLALLRSQLLLARGCPREALRALDAVARPGPGHGAHPPGPVEPSPWVTERTALVASAACLADGDPETAAQFLDEHPPEGPVGAVAAARVRLATGDGAAALELLDRYPARPGDGPAIAVRSLLTRAQAADALGDDAGAERALARALRLARPDRLRRPFTEAGPWLRRLLRRRPALAQAHDWLPATVAAQAAPPTGTVRQEPAPGSVPGRFPDSAPGSAPEPLPVLEALTAREQEVLERLSQMMSTEEIAADLFLSVNTVKTHLKSIYRKLGATRRGEAVRRARDLGLL
ncbi:LuxR C-terminal-related transcriptional regulator [Streptomyces cavernae]|uniref:LuxR C-terminal-related transcriptional regulator n=1 Tax=Streptomyces cavernae TaxID=2259034 RepID=UPI001EE45DA0|nr:LuxR C-terminal-related transcriptional regulator [Streptomyces cavernae]